VMRFWICHFADSPTATFFSPFHRDAAWGAKMYAITKLIYFSRLIWDFDAIRREYVATGTQNKRCGAELCGEVSGSTLFCCL
jgi:hypothetical protein